jgi:glycosyltransferase involved in cell wall biosynthesis
LSRAAVLKPTAEADIVTWFPWPGVSAVGGVKATPCILFNRRSFPANRCNISTPAISVCIPTYRGAAYLAQAIDSVLAQTFADFELLIVDDNSPDETPELVARYHDPRVRYLRNAANLGPQGNWNRCLQEARGAHVKLLPQDDWLMPECLQRQYEVLARDAHERIALVFCAKRVVAADGRDVVGRGYPGAGRGQIAGRAVTARCIRFGTNLVGEPGSVLFRRALAQRVGAFDATNPYVIDLDYWFRLLAHGDAYYLPEPLAVFRVSSGSWSVAIGKDQTHDFRAFIHRVAPTPAYAVSALDVFLGCRMAALNTRLRRLFYRFALR